ncbi:MAG: hypothetical protein GY749_48470 [Desulfobacteraceae bacterium]|nr:hypothetical protein [Desulfobacteraceae bacterium]
MEDHDAPSFKFGADEIHDPVFQMKRGNRREKVSHKGTFFSVFLFFLTGVLVFIAYLDIQKKIGKIYDSGSTEVQSLSEELEAKYKSLSSNYAKLEQELVKKVVPVNEMFSSLEAETGSLKDKLKKAETRIDKLGADKKEQAKTIAEMDKTLASLRENSAVSSDTEKFTEQISTLSEALNKTTEELNKIKAVIFEADNIDKESLDIALIKQGELYQKKLDLIIENLQNKEDKIEKIHNKLSELENMSKTFVRKKVSRPKKKPVKIKPLEKSDTPHLIDTIKPKPDSSVDQEIEE